MIFLFSRMMDYHVDAQFRKDPSGRLVFLPFGSKREGYFVDSKSDEEKIRSFVRMYRSASALFSLLIYPCICVPGWIINFYAGATPMRSRLTALVGGALVIMLVFLGALWMLWSVYKETVPGLTSSLEEVGPDMKGQLSELSRPPRLPLLVFIGAGAVLVGVAVLAALQYYRR